MNKIVIIVVFVLILAILVGSLVDVGLSVYRANELEKNTKFPPWPAKCPDYWSMVSEDKNGGVICRNDHGIGDCKSLPHDNEMDFSERIFKGNRGMYYKCNWAKKCNTPWEGIDSLC